MLKYAGRACDAVKMEPAAWVRDVVEKSERRLAGVHLIEVLADIGIGAERGTEKNKAAITGGMEGKYLE